MNIREIFQSQHVKSERRYKARYAKLDPISRELVETAADNLNSGTHTVADLTAISSRRGELFAQEGIGFDYVPWGGDVIWRASKKRLQHVPDYKLDRSGLNSEGKNLVGSFVDLFRDDPDLQLAIAKSFFGQSDIYDRSVSLFPKGKGLYSFEPIQSFDGPEGQGKRFHLHRRDASGDEEDLTIIISKKLEDILTTRELEDVLDGKDKDKPSIVYKHKRPGNEHEDVVVDYGLAVTGAREMLGRTRRDFTTQDLPRPVSVK